jgi:hypothetical protein
MCACIYAKVGTAASLQGRPRPLSTHALQVAESQSQCVTTSPKRCAHGIRKFWAVLPANRSRRDGLEFSEGAPGRAVEALNVGVPLSTGTQGPISRTTARSCLNVAGGLKTTS